MKTYHFEILTPRGRFFEGKVVHLSVPAEDGFVGVLRDHAPYVTSSPGGKVEARLLTGEARPFEVGPGFFQVLNNNALFLTQSAR